MRESKSKPELGQLGVVTAPKIQRNVTRHPWKGALEIPKDHSMPIIFRSVEKRSAT